MADVRRERERERERKGVLFCMYLTFQILHSGAGFATRTSIFIILNSILFVSRDPFPTYTARARVRLFTSSFYNRSPHLTLRFLLDSRLHFQITVPPGIFFTLLV